VEVREEAVARRYTEEAEDGIGGRRAEDGGRLRPSSSSLSPSGDAEAELWWKFRRTGKVRFRNSIARLYEAWVVGRTRTFAAARGVEWTELWGAAEIGLIDAIMRFDPSCGVPFLAFAARRVDGALLDAARQAAGRGWRERRRNTYRNRTRMRREGADMKTSSSPPDRPAGFLLRDSAFCEEDLPLSPEEVLPSREPDPSDAVAADEIVSRILDSMGSSTGDSKEDEDPRLREIARRRFVLLESIDQIGRALGLGRSRVDELLRHECLPRARGVMRRLGLVPRKRRLPASTLACLRACDSTHRQAAQAGRVG
jgi:RNA polymerase sigma factor for flagellar operon FliA